MRTIEAVDSICLFCQIPQNVAEEQSIGYLVPLVTLLAALVGLCAAMIAALINANATSMIAARSSVSNQFESVRKQLGRLLSSRNAIAIQGYPGLTADDLLAARRASYARFFERYTEETFAARASLAGLRSSHPTIRGVIESDEAQISSSQIALLWDALDEEESAALLKLKRWWLPFPASVSDASSRPQGRAGKTRD